MRKLVRLALVLIVLVTAGVAVLLTAAYRATQHVPEFYQAALAEPPVEQKAAADQLERQVLEGYASATASYNGNLSTKIEKIIDNGVIGFHINIFHSRFGVLQMTHHVCSQLVKRCLAAIRQSAM